MSEYPLCAAVSGETIIDEALLRGFIAYRSAALLYTAQLIDSKTGSGVAEYDCSSYDFCGRFQMTGANSQIGYFEFEIAGDGAQADLALEIRSDMAPASGDDGILLKSITIPAEWLPATAAYIMIPVALNGLSPNAYYWWRIRKAGDATNHFHAIGESSQDGLYPVYYRAASSGAWTAGNAVHFRAYNRTPVSDLLQAVVIGQAVARLEYIGQQMTGFKQYIPPVDTTAGGIRDVAALTYTNGLLTDVGVN